MVLMQFGVDVDEIFSPFVKPTTIRIVLSLVVSRHWFVHQLDRSPYGLKKAPRIRFQRLQDKFAYEVLKRDLMLNCNPCHTLIDIDSKLGADGDHFEDPTLCCSLTGFLTTRRSTSWYCVFLGNNLLFGSSKRHVTFSRSSTEAKYHGVVSAMHSEINIYFVTDLVVAGHMRVLHVPSRSQLADIFTKGIPLALFAEFCDNLSVRSTPALTEGPISGLICVSVGFVLLKPKPMC
nr:hypothetical protein [Tanacetum cinerariifolium]GEY45974.1 hypothetical protein [Tanacetum cinerariifolium]